MTKYKWPIIAAVAIIVGAIYVFWNPPSTKDRLEYWRGSYAELKQVYAADEQIKLATIAELEGQNALLQGSIDSANTVIARLEEGKADAEAALNKAREGWDALSAEAQAKLHELDDAWSKKFDILQGQYDEQEKVVFSLTKQYQAALSIGDTYKVLWEGEKNLRLKCEQGIHLADKRIASLQRTVRLTRYAALAVIVATVFLVKK
jgi:ABC-type sugar transport system substrate-binding protein